MYARLRPCHGQKKYVENLCHPTIAAVDTATDSLSYQCQYIYTPWINDRRVTLAINKSLILLPCRCSAVICQSLGHFVHMSAPTAVRRLRLCII